MKNSQKAEPETALDPLAIRRAAAARIAALQKEREALAPMRTEIEALGERLAKLDRERLALSAEMGGRHQDMMALDQSIDARIREEETFLRNGAKSILAEAVAFFQAKLADLRRAPRIGPGPDPGTSNFRSVHRCLSYCQRAIRQLAEMQLAPAPDFVRVEALKAEIPRTDTFESGLDEPSTAALHASAPAITGRARYLGPDGEADGPWTH